MIISNLRKGHGSMMKIFTPKTKIYFTSCGLYATCLAFPICQIYQNWPFQVNKEKYKSKGVP